MRHPNYVAVVVEGLALPPVHTAWVAAAVFTVINARNPSIDAVRLVEAGWDRSEQLVIAELPVTYERAAAALRALLAEHAPEVVVGVGLAAGRGRVGLERVAVNLRDARIPDNDGAQPTEGPVLDGGPTAVFTSLPVKTTLERSQAAEVPAELSLTAGTFVCNAVFYLGASWAQQRGGRRAGFVHVPTGDVVGSARTVRLSIDSALDDGEGSRTPGGALD